jgi:hypothetical protein
LWFDAPAGHARNLGEKLTQGWRASPFAWVQLRQLRQYSIRRSVRKILLISAPTSRAPASTASTVPLLR